MDERKEGSWEDGRTDICVSFTRVRQGDPESRADSKQGAREEAATHWQGTAVRLLQSAVGMGQGHCGENMLLFQRHS